MDAQQLYEKIRKHFTQPGARFGISDTIKGKQCSYLTEDGAKCAVGAVIPDKFADFARAFKGSVDSMIWGLGRRKDDQIVMDDAAALSLLDKDEAMELFAILDDDPQKIALLQLAQTAHDACAINGNKVSVFVMQLDRLALDLGLHVPSR